MLSMHSTSISSHVTSGNNSRSVFHALHTSSMPCKLSLPASALTPGIPLQARGTILSFLTAAAVLSVLSTDRTYNISHFTHGSEYSSARSAFAGYLVSATADFALIYHLGIIPGTPPESSPA